MPETARTSTPPPHSESEFPLRHPGDPPGAEARARVRVDLGGIPFDDHGAYASVYKGTLHVGGAEPLKVAVKALRKRDSDRDVKLEKRLKDEAERWRKLDHPRLLIFLGTVEDRSKGILCMVSPLMENHDALSYLAANPEVNRGALLLHVAEALDYLHAKASVVHGDIKGDNVLICSEGTARLADFGLTRIHEEVAAATSNPSLTTPSVRAAGAARFKAPEQHFTLPTPKKTTHADMWSFGMLIYQFFTLEAPFAELNDACFYKALVKEDRPKKRPQIPEEWWDLARACWAEVPKERPTSAIALVGAQDASKGKEIPVAKSASSWSEFLRSKFWWSV